jgi:hypothetical protein
MEKQNNRFAKIPGNGITILRHIHEVMNQIETLATTDCRDSAEVLQRCEAELVGISIDIASVCSPGKDWDFVSDLLASAGIKVPDELDQAIREAE